MPTGRPSSAGTSKDSIERTNRISTAPSAAGQASCKVTRRATCGTEAPLIAACSSSAGSMERNGADGELHRVEKEPRGFGAGIGGAEILERELRRGGGAVGREHALPEQEDERHQREPDDERDGRAKQQPFAVEPRRNVGQRCDAP